MSPLEEETLKYPILKIFSVCYYSAPLPRQKQFKRINTVGTKGKEKKREKRLGTFFAFFSLLVFCYYIHLLYFSTLSLSPPCPSLCCLLFAPHFSLPFKRTSPLVWLFITKKKKKIPKTSTMKKIRVQHLEE